MTDNMSTTATGQTANDNSGEVRFSAVLEPYRSLGPDGFVVVMALIAGISFVAGIAFLMMGAWPVLGFFGLDVLLIYWAFKANYHAARVRETIEVTDRAVIVRHFDARGAMKEWSFQSYWLRIEMQEDEETCGPLYLKSHGRRISVGAFLPAEERRDFARALRAAIAQ